MSIHDTATVTVSEPVDGTVVRPTRGPDKRARQAVATITLDKRVLAAAQRLIGGGTYTRYEIVSATEAVVR